MTSDLLPMCALTFGSMLIYHIIICWLVYTGLYCYFITSSSTDFLYIIIYIGHIADSTKPYHYRLVSASAIIGYRLELIHRLVSRSAVLIYYLHILSVAGSNWLARSHLTNLWTCTGVKQISQADVFDFFVNSISSPWLPLSFSTRMFFKL